MGPGVARILDPAGAGDLHGQAVAPAAALWCPGKDSNLHTLAGART